MKINGRFASKEEKLSIIYIGFSISKESEFDQENLLGIIIRSDLSSKAINVINNEISIKVMTFNFDFFYKV